MIKMHIYDGNAWLRKLFEADRTGLPLRTFITEINSTAGVPIVVWDGLNGNARRRKLYPLYKRNRLPAAEDIFATFRLAKELLKLTKALQVEVYDYEGDDVIASLATTYSSQTTVEIYTVDRDLYALCVLPHVQLVGARPPKVPHDHVRLFKATVGDPSDNIKGIKGFGPAAWEACDKEALTSWYTEGCPQLSLDVPKIMDEFSVSNAHALWLITNRVQAKCYWDIVGFMPPTSKEIEENTIVGQRDDAALTTRLKEFLQ